MAMTYNEMLEKIGLAKNVDPEDVVAVWQNLQTMIAGLKEDLKNTSNELMICRENEDILQRRLRAIYDCIGEENIVAKMTNDISTDNVIDMYIRERNLR